MMEAHEMSSSPEGNYYSEKGDLTDEKMDTSDTTAGSDKTFSSPESVNGQSKCDNANVNNSVAADELDLKYRMRSDNSTSSLPSDDFDLAKSYQVETVDFPDDPHILKMMNKMTIDKLGFVEEQPTAEIAEDSGPMDDEVFSHGLCQKNVIERAIPKERPNNISTDGSLRRKKIAVSPDILCADRDDEKSLSSLSFRSDGEVYSPIDDVATPDDVDTPEELEESCIQSPDPIPELSAAEERAEERRWRTCMIAGVQRKIDMKVIEPYKKVLSHGGYFGPSHYAIIVFGACHLPDHSRKDYDYVMDNLFLYVLTTLDQLVAEDYVLIYLHGAMDRGNMPTFGWLKRCYQMIDRRLRKTLKGLYLVHPTFWLKTLVLMTKPFISTKFSRKLQFVHSLQELAELVPVDQICIPDKVKQYDEERRLLLTQ